MAPWISKLAAFLRNWRNPSRSGSNEAISNAVHDSLQERAPQEIPLRDRVSVVSIFVNENSKIERGEPARARVNQFRPKKNPQTSRLEKSSLCLEEIDAQEGWRRLQECSIRQVLGRADLRASQVNDVELSLDADWQPERHVNIIDLPEAEELIGDMAQKLYRAHVFARRAQA